jgi:hypothetical protein
MSDTEIELKLPLKNVKEVKEFLDERAAFVKESFSARHIL